MLKNRSKQTAGDHSNQFQIDSATIINGVDEKRVREVFSEMLPLALKNYAHESEALAKERVAIFEEKLLENIVKTSTIEALKDPAIQLQLVEAQKAAISTDREQDYDMLAELMIQRFKSANNRNRITGISKAIEAVDKLSDEALQGLTLLFAIPSYKPSRGDISARLQILEQLYSNLKYSELPAGEEWIDILEIHDAVKVSNFGSMKKFEQFWYEQLDGLIKNGIPKNSGNYEIARRKLLSVNLNENCLINNDDNTYVKIDVRNKSDIKELSIIDGLSHQSSPLTGEQVAVFEEIYDLYDGTGMDVDIFSDMIDNYSTLKEIKTWWNNLSAYSIRETIIGKVLAETNALRIMPDLPR